MLKKTLLSALIAASTIATAHINLNIDITITDQVNEYKNKGSVVVEENVPMTIEFTDIDALVVGINAQTEDNIVTIQARFFEKNDADELSPISDVFTVPVPFNEPAIITLDEPNNAGSIILSIIPTIVE